MKISPNVKSLDNIRFGNTGLTKFIVPDNVTKCPQETPTWRQHCSPLGWNCKESGRKITAHDFVNTSSEVTHKIDL